LKLRLGNAPVTLYDQSFHVTFLNSWLGHSQAINVSHYTLVIMIESKPDVSYLLRLPPPEE
jgi:hypothetical protein